MSLPLLVVCDCSFEHNRLTPFFAQWLGQTTQTLTDWRMLPKCVAQILEERIDRFPNKVYVKLRCDIIIYF